jgi:hypothetical protein
MNYCRHCHTWSASRCTCASVERINRAARETFDGLAKDLPAEQRALLSRAGAYSQQSCQHCGQVKLLYHGILQCLGCDLLVTKIALLAPPPYDYERDGECGP